MNRPLPTLAIAGKNLHTAATNALRLLEMIGQAGFPGDTVDDLRAALCTYDQAINEVIAAQHAPEPEEPDLAALTAAHRMLRVPTPLHAALDCPKLRVVLAAVARKTKLRPVSGADAYRAVA
jgi:hypothetical protein